MIGRDELSVWRGLKHSINGIVKDILIAVFKLFVVLDFGVEAEVLLF